MRRSVCIRIFEKYVKEVSAGRGYRKHTNPVLEFTRNAKAHKYDTLSDPEYDALLAETEEEAALWLGKSSQTASELLRIILENIEIDENTLHKLAELLSACYAASIKPFTAEDRVPDAERLAEAAAWSAKQPEQRKGYRSPSGKTDVDGDGNKSDLLQSPKQIYAYLAERIYGQEEAVKAASMLLYNHVHGRRRNLLLTGPTGCGKTEIWRVCRQIYPYVHIVDSTAITAQGWSGSFKLKDIFAGMSRDEAEKAIIVFDEFDKFCEPKIGSGGMNYSQMQQNELLKLIEGDEMVFPEQNGSPEMRINSSSISFVFCGSFECLMEKKASDTSAVSIGFGGNLEKQDAYSLYEHEIYPRDLVKYAGMRQEIAGRINQIVRLAPMTAEDYQVILHDKRLSPLHQLERQYGVRLRIGSDAMQQLAENAEETRMGVRYLHSRIQQMLDEQMFQDCGRKEYRLDA